METGLALKRSRAVDFLELTKPRVTSLVLVTTAVGFYMQSGSAFAGLPLVHTMVGTSLVAGGASAANQYMERTRDARMLRTRERPLPGARLSETDAFVFSTAISIAGVLYLALLTNPLTGLLAALTILLYLFVYTPLKTRTSLATIVGAVPGAAPPVLGWAGAGGELDLVAGALFAIVFLGQLPHVLAIAWLYDEDYHRGGFTHLTIRNAGEAAASRQIVFYCSLLLPVSLLPTSLGATGTVYMFGALLAGIAYLGYGLAVALLRSPQAARRLLRASVIYLPAVFLLMVIDRTL
jgi:protoheme IX farnesyltransferase